MSAPKIGDLNLGNYLKIVSQNGVWNNLSEESGAWSLILKKKKSAGEGRELRYLLRSAYGDDAVGFLPVSGGAYPNAHETTTVEAINYLKDFGLTIEVQNTVIAKAMKDFARYGEPLAEEMRAKTAAMARNLSAALYADGTGVLAQTSGAGTISSGKVVFPVATTNTARGFIGWIQPGSRLVPRQPDGTARNPTLDSGTFAYYQVESKDRDNNTVTLVAKNAAGSSLTVTATNLVAGDFLYKNQQAVNGTTPDLSSIGSTDYNTLSEAFVGLEALTADDGRKVHGVTLSGALAGSRRDCGGNPIDSLDFQQIMSKVRIAVGAGAYKYNKALMAHETLTALIESREVDRRFQSIQDNQRGVAQLGYVAGKDALVFEPDEFCPGKRIYVCPEGDVLQYHGTDFEMTNIDGTKQFLKPNSSGHDRVSRMYMEGQGTLACVHAAAIGVIHNFTNNV